MLCFIDESGDTGRKTTSGSSEYFTIAMILFNENDEANACDQRIELLRRELGLNQEYEFHFSHSSDRARQAFFEALHTYDFFYLGFTINKKHLYGKGFQYKGSFYKYTTSLILENAKPYLSDAIIIFDGNGSREFRKQLKTYLKKKVNNTSGVQHIKDVKVQDSHRNNLIQLTDMICGALAMGLKKRENSDKYHRIISHREISWQVCPKDK